MFGLSHGSTVVSSRDLAGGPQPAAERIGWASQHPLVAAATSVNGHWRALGRGKLVLDALNMLTQRGRE